MAAAFDTLKAATRLREEAGFEERQATVLVELFADRYGDRENLATRDDVAAVRGEVTMLRDDVTVMRGRGRDHRRPGQAVVKEIGFSR